MTGRLVAIALWAFVAGAGDDRGVEVGAVARDGRAYVSSTVSDDLMRDLEEPIQAGLATTITYETDLREEVGIWFDRTLASATHVSLAQSVKIIAHAKKRGVRVTAEATPHHLLLTEQMAKEIGPNAKVNPPLRSDEDVAAIREGLANGTIDIIASDHAPHSPEEKTRPWDQAPFGVIGLETTLGLVLTFLVCPGILTLSQAIEKLTIMPARIFGLDVLGVGSLRPGVQADLTLIDLDRKWKVDVDCFYSKERIATRGRVAMSRPEASFFIASRCAMVEDMSLLSTQSKALAWPVLRDILLTNSILIRCCPSRRKIFPRLSFVTGEVMMIALRLVRWRMPLINRSSMAQ